MADSQIRPYVGLVRATLAFQHCDPKGARVAVDAALRDAGPEADANLTGDLHSLSAAIHLGAETETPHAPTWRRLVREAASAPS